MKRLVILLMISALFLGCQLMGINQSSSEMAEEESVTEVKERGYDSSGFIADVTIPDNMVMKPGKKFDKTWRLINRGSTTWKDYNLVFTHGDRLGAPKQVSVPVTPPGKEVDITIPMKAPEEPGSYQGFWKMMNDLGETFGVGIWVQIKVE